VDRSQPSEDPWAVLGISAQADDAQIRAAYLSKLREFPPERAPEAFERVRDAYEALRTPQQRARRWFKTPPCGSFTELLDAAPAQRRYCGPGPWLEALRRS
jgi:hypothetical protein